MDVESIAAAQGKPETILAHAGISESMRWSRHVSMISFQVSSAHPDAQDESCLEDIAA